VAGGNERFALSLASDLALAGFTAQDDAIEEALTSLVGDGFEPAKLLRSSARVGDHAELASPAGLLQSIYAALDALEAAVASLDAKAGDVERIDVATFRFASAMRNPDPPNYFASKYSLPHVAACLVCGQRRFRGGRRLRARRSCHYGAAPPRPHCRGSLDESFGAAAKPAASRSR